MALVLGVSACSETDADPFAAAERRFTLLPAAETGVAFTNVLPENPVMNGFVYEYYYNGGGVAVGDLSGNGFPDLYFTSNLEDELDPSTPKLDGGIGLLLRGDGDGGGGFDPVVPSESGLLLQGQVRRLAAIRLGAGGMPALMAGVVGGELVHLRTAAGPAAVTLRQDRRVVR